MDTQYSEISQYNYLFLTETICDSILKTPSGNSATYKQTWKFSMDRNIPWICEFKGYLSHFFPQCQRIPKRGWVSLGKSLSCRGWKVKMALWGHSQPRTSTLTGARSTPKKYRDNLLRDNGLTIQVANMSFSLLCVLVFFSFFFLLLALPIAVAVALGYWTVLSQLLNLDEGMNEQTDERASLTWCFRITHSYACTCELPFGTSPRLHTDTCCNGNGFVCHCECIPWLDRIGLGCTSQIQRPWSSPAFGVAVDEPPLYWCPCNDNRTSGNGNGYCSFELRQARSQLKWNKHEEVKLQCHPSFFLHWRLVSTKFDSFVEAKWWRGIFREDRPREL